MMLPQMLIERRFLVDRNAIRRYAEITHDYNPIHVDPDFAAKTPLRGVIAHGMLSLSLIWQSLTSTLGKEDVGTVKLDIRFVHPVRENDWAVSGGALTEARTYDVWVRTEANGGSLPVITGTATVGRVP